MPPSIPWIRQRSQSSAAGLLFTCVTFAYWLACAPSYSRQYWPPPDRIVEGIPWIWVFGIPLFTLALPGGRACRNALAAFAMVTAIIDAWTLPYANMNPHVGDEVDLAVANLIFVFPLHLFVTVLVAPLSRFISNRISMFHRWVAAAIMVVLAVVFPFAYRSITVTLDNAGGAKLADQDWADHRAGIITTEPILYRETADGSFASYFDASGLPLWQSWYGRYEPGYTAEVRRLVATQGVPSWSQKIHLVSDADIIRIASDPGMTKVLSYPYQITPKNRLERGDGGIVIYGASGGLFARRRAIGYDQTTFASVSDSSDTNDPVFVGQMDKYPGDYFVRSGKSVVVCTIDGAILESADCEPPPSTRP